jgi:DNA polymerase
MQFLQIRDPLSGHKSGTADDRETATVIRAQLIGDNRATALGFEGCGSAPVLDLARKLVNAGQDPDRPLHAYRGEVLCLRLRSIGEGAGIELNHHGTGFRWGRASPIAPPASPLGQGRPDAGDAPDRARPPLQSGAPMTALPGAFTAWQLDYAEHGIATFPLKDKRPAISDAGGEAAAAPTHVLYRDFETRGVISLKRAGAHKYAADPGTEVVCVAYALDDEPVQIWTPTDPIPSRVVEAANNPDYLVAAHGPFELVFEQNNLGPRFGWPQAPLSRQRCTMSLALAHSLPASLEKAAKALNLILQKDKAGQRLMLQMAKPRRARKSEDPNGVYFFDDDARKQRLYAYCMYDVQILRELYQRLRPLSEAEQELWQLDQSINQRGFYVDRTFAKAALKVARAVRPAIDAELEQITGGAVTRVGQVTRLQAWVRERGCCDVLKLDKKAIGELLDTGLPPEVQRVLELRRDGAQSATKKIDSLLASCGADGRVRGALKFHGASTGRWTGSNFQPQNLKRPEVDDLDSAIAAVATGDLAQVKAKFPRPLSVIGDITRSLICAAPGKVLIGADLSSIESRVLAWIAGEEWKLDTYRRFDATQDPRDEPYCITACKIFGKPGGTFNPGSPERKVGKTCDLAFGDQGGLGAWRKFEPDRFSDQKVEQFKVEWRAAHPAIKKFWYGVDVAAWKAVRDRGQIVRCGRLAFLCRGTFLLLRLPSGRKLAYPYPRIEIEDLEHQVVVTKDNSAGQWRDCRHGNGLYGGLLTENVVQAISRDLLAEAMLRIEAGGYPIVLHVHDEVIAEVPEGFGSAKQFTRLMTRVPAWAEGLPIAARAWTGQRFCKS